MSIEGLDSETWRPKERSPEYVKILTELEHILEGTEEEQQIYVDERIRSLSEHAEGGQLSHVGTGIHKGFIGQEMKIRRNMTVDPFVMDDDGIYSDLFTTLRELRQQEGWKQRSLREMMPTAIQWTLSRYFGNVAAERDTEMRNRQFYLDHTTVESPAVSINELRGEGLAVCAEKGAAAQNLLAFAGMESDLLASSRCRIPEEAEEDAHYYIVIHGSKGEMIYDPTNPRMISDKEGKLINYSPAMYPITQGESDRLVAGEPITVEHVDDTSDDAGQRVPQTSKRLYGGPGQH